MNQAVLVLQVKSLNIDDNSKYIVFYEKNKNNRDLKIKIDPIKTKIVVEEVMSEHFYERATWIRDTITSGASKNGIGLNLMLFLGMADYISDIKTDCTEYITALIPKLFYEIVKINQ